MASRPRGLPDLTKEPPDIVTFLFKKLEIPNLQPLLLDGLFVHTTDTGIVFSGIIVNFALHGRGTVVWPDGSVFTGIFDKGIPDGKGQFIKKDSKADSVLNYDRSVFIKGLQ